MHIIALLVDVSGKYGRKLSVICYRNPFHMAVVLGDMQTFGILDSTLRLQVQEPIVNYRMFMSVVSRILFGSG